MFCALLKLLALLMFLYSGYKSMLYAVISFHSSLVLLGGSCWKQISYLF